MQFDLVKKIGKKFKKEIEAVRGSYKTPSPPSEHVKRTDTNTAVLSDEKQKLYRSGVGILLYLVKISRPDLSNSVRELSKVMDKATEYHYKLMIRAAKYTCETERRCLTLKPTIDHEMIWTIRAFCDSDFSGDTDTRRSVTGYIIYLNGAPIAWKSKSQRSVTISSTESSSFSSSTVFELHPNKKRPQHNVAAAISKFLLLEVMLVIT